MNVFGVYYQTTETIVRSLVRVKEKTPNQPNLQDRNSVTLPRSKAWTFLAALT